MDVEAKYTSEVEMFKIMILIFSILASSFCLAEDEYLTLSCETTLIKQGYFDTYKVGKHFEKELSLKSKIFNKSIKKTALTEEFKIDKEYSLSLNIKTEFGKLNSTTEIEMTLLRHRGGNGKILLGESSGRFLRDLDKTQTYVLEVLNTKDLSSLLNKADEFFYGNDYFLEAVNKGYFAKGVVKNAFIECSIL